MEQSDLIIIVVGIVSSVLIVALAWIAKSRYISVAHKALAESVINLVNPLLLSLVTNADVVLAKYGENKTIKTIHTLAEQANGILETVGPNLPAELRNILQDLVEKAEMLTDGEIEAPKD
ncbi:MAG: hypothetical protein WC196_07090 [Bacilli bacterium]